MENTVSPLYRTSERNSEKPIEADLSYRSAVQEIGSSMKDLLRSEVALLRAEVAKALPEFQKNSTKLATATALYMLGLLPFIAFMVLGLGDVLGITYAVSSLLVSLVLVAIAMPLRASALKKLKAASYFEKSKENLESSLQVIENKFDKIITATKGDHHGTRSH